MDDNVVLFSSVKRDGKRQTLTEGPEAAKEIIRDQLLKSLDDSGGVFAITEDASGKLSVVSGGLLSITAINMFLDIIKDELKNEYKIAMLLSAEDSGWEDIDADDGDDPFGMGTD